MSKLNVILLIIGILLFIIGLLVILFLYFNNNIKELLYKTDDSEESIYEKLKDKNSIVIRLIKIIENRYKVESKIFEQVKKIKQDQQSLFKSDKLLTKCYDEIIQIKEDNSKIKEVKSFKDIIFEYEDNEIHIISLRTYYNKYVLSYNNLINKFPYNIVSKIKKYKLKILFEGKEFDENFNNDIEV